MVAPMLRLLLLAGSVFGLFTFERGRAGHPPEGFEIVGTMPPAPRWVVQRDAGQHVLAQTVATPEDMIGRHSFALVEGGVYGDVTLQARIKLLTANGQAGLVFRYQDRDNHYLLTLDARQRKIRLVRVAGGNRVSIHGEDDVDLETGVWYQLKLRVEGPAIAARMNGLRLFEAQDRTLPERGRIGFFCDDHTRAHFDDLDVASIEKREKH
jgi:hypothetical protein